MGQDQESQKQSSVPRGHPRIVLLSRKQTVKWANCQRTTPDLAFRSRVSEAQGLPTCVTQRQHEIEGRPESGGIRAASGSERPRMPSLCQRPCWEFISCVSLLAIPRGGHCYFPLVRTRTCRRSHSGRHKTRMAAQLCLAPRTPFCQLHSLLSPTVLRKLPGPPAPPEPVCHVPVLLHLHTHNLCHQGDDLLPLLQALPVLHRGHLALFD